MVRTVLKKSEELLEGFVLASLKSCALKICFSKKIRSSIFRQIW